MAWSTKKPTIEGYYWVKAKGQLSGQEYIHPVKVYRSSRLKPVPDSVFSDGDNFSIKHDLFMEWWDEQIVLPEKDALSAFILKNWDRDKTRNFAKGLLGDECLNKFHCPRI